MKYRSEDLLSILDVLKKRLKIAVIYAGTKDDPERVHRATIHTRSWKSYEVVANDIAGALRNNGFAHIEVLPEGVDLLPKLKQHNIDMVWINSAGVQGNNPMAHAPSLLEMAGIPYVGHRPYTAALLDNKHAFKGELRSYGIPTGRWYTWDMTRGAFRPDINSRFKQVFTNYSGPFIVKPISGRASLNVEVVDTVKELPAVVESIFKIANNHVLIEEYFGGSEYCIGVCPPLIINNGQVAHYNEPFAFSEIIRILDKHERIFTSMDKRPITSSRARVLNRTNPDEQKVIEQLRHLAQTIFLDFRLNALVRIDIRADFNGNLHVLEANPKPDLKRYTEESVSLIAIGLNELGLSYEDLILSLFAGKLHYLLQHAQGTIQHIVKHLD